MEAFSEQRYELSLFNYCVFSVFSVQVSIKKKNLLNVSLMRYSVNCQNNTKPYNIIIFCDFCASSPFYLHITSSLIVEKGIVKILYSNFTNMDRILMKSAEYSAWGAQVLRP